MGNRTKIFYNNIPQQKKGTECGMYCIVFLLNMAKTGGDFVYTVNNMPSDDELNEKRAEFFNLIGDDDDNE
jgi:Ulp1 family protease